MMAASQELLEHLARLANCEYLSDLRCRVPAEVVEEALRVTGWEDFPAVQWREAERYLTGGDCVRGSGEGCRRRLLEHYQSRERKNKLRP